MVADTIVIVLVCIKSAQPAKVIPHKQENRFVELFKEADILRKATNCLPSNQFN